MQTRLYSVPEMHPKQIEACDAFRRYVRELAGGYTFIPAHGAWMDPAGKLFRENVALIIVSGDDETLAKVDAAHREYGEAAGEQAIYSVTLGEARIDAIERKGAA